VDSRSSCALGVAGFCSILYYTLRKKKDEEIENEYKSFETVVSQNVTQFSALNVLYDQIFKGSKGILTLLTFLSSLAVTPSAKLSPLETMFNSALSTFAGILAKNWNLADSVNVSDENRWHQSPEQCYYLTKSVISKGKIMEDDINFPPVVFSKAIRYCTTTTHIGSGMNRMMAHAGLGSDLYDCDFCKPVSKFMLDKAESFLITKKLKEFLPMSVVQLISANVAIPVAAFLTYLVYKIAYSAIQEKRLRKKPIICESKTKKGKKCSVNGKQLNYLRGKLKGRKLSKQEYNDLLDLVLSMKDEDLVLDVFDKKNN